MKHWHIQNQGLFELGKALIRKELDHDRDLQRKGEQEVQVEVATSSQSIVVTHATDLRWLTGGSEASR